MTVSVAEMRMQVSELIKAGVPFRLKYFSVSGADANYDDQVTIAQSGTDIWGSGLAQAIDSRKGSTEAILVQEGKITVNDLKFYVNGSLNVSGTFRIGLGSPVTKEYGLSPGGIITEPPFGGAVYQKIYLRFLPTGSLMGE